MKQPKITVIERNIEAENWKNGYVIYCLKFSNGEYSSDYGLDQKVNYEKIIYEGLCPPELRILPKIDKKYLVHYWDFNSQRVPKKIDKRIAKAVRGYYDPLNIYDTEIYNANGEIINSINCWSSKDVDGVYKYITSFLKKEDWDRIKKYDEDLNN